MLLKSIKRLAVLAASVFSVSVHAVQACTMWADFNSQGVSNVVTMQVPSQSDFHLQGKLIYRTLLQEEATHWLGFQLYKPRAMLNNETSLSHEYGVPFAVKIDNQTGEVIKYIFNAELKQADKSKLIGIHRAIHLARKPKEEQGDRFLLVESDDLGPYESEYIYDGSGRVERNKIRYMPLTRSAKASVLANSLVKLDTAQVVSDKFVFEQEGCWHKTIKGHSQIKVQSNDGTIAMDVTQTLELKRSASPLPDDARLLLLPENPEQWQPMAIDSIYPKAPARPLASKDIFLRALQQIDFIDGERANILQFLYDNDQYVGELKQLIIDQSLSDDVESKLFMYLGKHDTHNAHLLLTEVFLLETLTPNQRFRSLMALRYSNNSLQDELVQAVFDYSVMEQTGENLTLANTALMVMGTIAKNQKGTDFSRQVTQKIVDTLSASRSVHTSAALIAALGNSADVAQESVISRYLQADDGRLRKQAASTLSKMPSASSLNKLSHQLNQEKDSKVQSSLIAAMGNNQLSNQHLQTIVSYAGTSQDSEVRSAAIDALAVQAKDNQLIKPQLIKLLKTESNKHNVRKLMKAIYGT